MHKTLRFRAPGRRTNLFDSQMNTPEPPLPVQRIMRLLESESIDLTRISEEIRAHPDLESLVLRMAVSLSLSPVDSYRNLDEAVVVLGADRLRVLLYTWSLLERKTLQVRPSAAPGSWSPEALYLASFLRYLGLDSPDAAILHSEMFCFALESQREEFADLRDTLMRDFLSLIPVLDPSILRVARDRLEKRDSSREGSS